MRSHIVQRCFFCYAPLIYVDRKCIVTYIFCDVTITKYKIKIYIFKMIPWSLFSEKILCVLNRFLYFETLCILRQSFSKLIVVTIPACQWPHFHENYSYIHWSFYSSIATPINLRTFHFISKWISQVVLGLPMSPRCSSKTYSCGLVLFERLSFVIKTPVWSTYLIYDSRKRPRISSSLFNWPNFL